MMAKVVVEDGRLFKGKNYGGKDGRTLVVDWVKEGEKTREVAL